MMVTRHADAGGLHRSDEPGWQRSVRHAKPSVLPVEVVYRAAGTAPVPPASPAMMTPAAAPAPPVRIDVERISGEVMQRIEKRLRIERERHGRS
jgi:hypothetical protein